MAFVEDKVSLLFQDAFDAWHQFVWEEGETQRLFSQWEFNRRWAKEHSVRVKRGGETTSEPVKGNVREDLIKRRFLI